MPTYHFKVTRPRGTYTGDDGMRFDSIDGAWEEATIAGGLLVKEIDGDLSPGKSCSIEVLDEFHNTS